ncbi:hypothetical protein B0T26DRAFT_747648 [Lasiosphaeria miniovina]|uniref:Uncharacterized protein n=1 Tax=Lasiosphaeria miniovina TaxID=1954250 RepID=A0AA40B478_9PEZI|nr:uncharacterized protein B0T26DRAFT_747648 [Lasiosphaeria miniovina]KAK0727305.1 hypothetical protein B0T26DRAFT_747648 [Lasiosphaeria miniovina]
MGGDFDDARYTTSSFLSCIPARVTWEPWTKSYCVTYHAACKTREWMATYTVHEVGTGDPARWTQPTPPPNFVVTTVRCDVCDQKTQTITAPNALGTARVRIEGNGVTATVPGVRYMDAPGYSDAHLGSAGDDYDNGGHGEDGGNSPSGDSQGLGFGDRFGYEDHGEYNAMADPNGGSGAPQSGGVSSGQNAATVSEHEGAFSSSDGGASQPDGSSSPAPGQDGATSHQLNVATKPQANGAAQSLPNTAAVHDLSSGSGGSNYYPNDPKNDHKGWPHSDFAGNDNNKSPTSGGGQKTGPGSHAGTPSATGTAKQPVVTAGASRALKLKMGFMMFMGFGAIAANLVLA